MRFCLVICVCFSIAGFSQADRNDSTDSTIICFIPYGENPEFPGGLEGLYNYLKKNIRYPNLCGGYFAGGKVFLSFIIREDGRITDIEVMKGLPEALWCEKEAIRVIQNMPKWKPGTMAGKPVAVKYALPVKFGPFGNKNE
jgi:hypothetical protein